MLAGGGEVVVVETSCAKKSWRAEARWCWRPPLQKGVGRRECGRLGDTLAREAFELRVAERALG
eukprot:357108-Chlamydomonas_euryale.AAC.7